MGLINVIGEVLKAILGGALGALVELIDSLGRKSHDYKATFGSRNKVFRNSKDASLYIGAHAIDPHVTFASSALIGRTGSGKSTKVYHASLLQTPMPKKQDEDAIGSMSYFVLDPAGELERDTAAYNESIGYVTEVLNFADSNRSTVTWNPIDDLTDAEVSRFASEYIETALNRSKSNDPFWGLAAQRVLANIIRILQVFGKQYTNLYNARFLVQTMSGNKEEMDTLLSLKCIPKAIFEEHASLVNMGQKLLSSVLATVLASLEIFSNPEIAKITSSTSLKMEDYRTQSRMLFVQTRVMDQKYVSILNTLLLSKFFSFCMSEIPDDTQNSIAFFLDESSSLQISPDLISLASSNLRKHRSFFVAGFQSVAQMQDLYGKEHARTILQNIGTTLYFPHQDAASSRELSELLGKYSYEKPDKTVHSRQLLTIDEVSFLKHKEGGLLISGSERPVLLKNIRPFYKNKRLLKWSNMPKVEREYLNIPMPELLPISKLIKTQ